MKPQSFWARYHLFLGRHYRSLGMLCLALFALSARMLLPLMAPHLDWPGQDEQEVIGFAVAALAAALGMFWLIFCSWYTVSFRDLWLVCAKILGRSYRWATSEWRSALAPAVIASFLVCSYGKYVLDETLSLQWFFTGIDGPWLQTIVVALLLTIVWNLYTSRKRLFIVGFENHTGMKSLQEPVDGFPRRLQAELSAIQKLHQSVQGNPFSLEQPSPCELKASPCIETGGAGESFNEVTMGEAKVRLFGFEFDLVKLSRLVANMTGGNRIRGSLQRTSPTEYCLMATLKAQGMTRSWQVFEQDLDMQNEDDKENESPDARAPSSEPGPAGPQPDPVAERTEDWLPAAGILDQMVSQLAYRVFTDLEQERLGTPSWRAVVHYTNAMREIRKLDREQEVAVSKCVRGLIIAPCTRTLCLHRAERNLLRALHEDPGFARCQYNLGVIYFLQGNAVAAASAFERVCTIRPTWSDGYYALALTSQSVGVFENAMSLPLRSTKKFEDAMRQSLQCVELSPFDAKGWLSAGTSISLIHPDRDARAFLSTALSFAWKSFCRAELSMNRSGNGSSSMLAISCILQLARSFRDASEADRKNLAPFARRSERDRFQKLMPTALRDWYFSNRSLELSRQAIQLDRTQPLSHWAEAFLLLKKNQPERATKCLDRALQLADFPPFWLSLGIALDEKAFAEAKGRRPRIHFTIGKHNSRLRSVKQTLKRSRQAWASALQGAFSRDLELYQWYFRQIGLPHWTSKRVERAMKLLQDVENELHSLMIAVDDSNIDLNKWEQWLSASKNHWEKGVVGNHLGSIKLLLAQKETDGDLCKKQAAEAATTLKKASDTLNRSNLTKQLVFCRTQTALAQAYAVAGQWDSARQAARAAKALLPDQGYERLVCSLIHLAEADFERGYADLALARTLGCGPTGLRAFPMESFARALGDIANRDQHQRVAEGIIGILKDETRFFDTAMPGYLSPVDFIGWAHYWLGRFTEETGVHIQAAAHFKAAAHNSFRPQECYARLCAALWRANAFHFIEAAYVEFLTLSKKLPSVLPKAAARAVETEREPLPATYSLALVNLYSALALVETKGDLLEAQKRVNTASNQRKSLKSNNTLWNHVTYYIDLAAGMIHLAQGCEPLHGKKYKGRKIAMALADFKKAEMIPNGNHADLSERLAQACQERADIEPVRRKWWEAEARQARKSCARAAVYDGSGGNSRATHLAEII